MSLLSDPEHRLVREQFIPRPLEEVFAFFATADNLEKLTPPWVGFRILSSPRELSAGARIEYRIALGGVPVRWRTLIRAWDPPHGFADVQERGPYALWDHTHRFRALGEGTLMTDTVRYRVPFRVLGPIAHAVGVRASVGAIFDYRFDRVRELFPA